MAYCRSTYWLSTSTGVPGTRRRASIAARRPSSRWRRRHPDVHDRHVRAMSDDGVHERRAVADLRDDRAARLLDQPRDPLADECRVLRDDDAQRCGFHRQIMRAARGRPSRSTPQSRSTPLSDAGQDEPGAPSERPVRRGEVERGSPRRARPRTPRGACSTSSFFIFSMASIARACCVAVGALEHLVELPRHDLPGHAEAVLQPAAHAVLAAALRRARPSSGRPRPGPRSRSRRRSPR